MKPLSLLMLLMLYSISGASIFKANNYNSQQIVDPYFSQGFWAANINNGGIDDLVFTSLNDQGLVIYLGKGGGKFNQLFSTPAIGPVKVSTVFDADGDDVWLQSDTSNNESRDVILFNNGRGGFKKSHQ